IWRAAGVVQGGMRLRGRRLVSILATVSLASAVFAQTAQENAADAAWLVKVLEIPEGTVVGEIGAGGGELTVAMAKAVGPSGRVFSNELNQERLKALSGVAEQAEV